MKQSFVLCFILTSNKVLCCVWFNVKEFTASILSKDQNTTDGKGCLFNETLIIRILESSSSYRAQISIVQHKTTQFKTMNKVKKIAF